MFDDLAVEMTCVHNCFIRGINAIYLQAPYITQADAKSFCNYAAVWSKMIHIHHHEEESIFFPEVEKMANEEGLMAGNVEQHHAFHDGLENYQAFVDGVLSGKDVYDGKKLVSIIDSFGGILTQHLTDEIPTLLGLKKFGTEKFKDYKALANKLAENALAAAGSTTGIIFVVTCLDVNFEGGRWSDFPPIPWVVNMMFRYIHFWVHRDWWRFAPCDRLGSMRPLYAVPAE